MSFTSLKKRLSAISLLGHSLSSKESLIETSPEPKTDVLTVTVYQDQNAWEPKGDYIAAAIRIEFTHRTATDITPDADSEEERDPELRRAVQSAFRSEMTKTQETWYQGELKDLLGFRIAKLNGPLVSTYSDVMSDVVSKAPESVSTKSLDQLGVELQVIKDEILPGQSALADLIEKSTWLFVTGRGEYGAADEFEWEGRELTLKQKSQDET